MWPVIRLRRAAALALVSALALAPLAAHATSSPRPSLDKVLVAPPSANFSELPSSPLHGVFTAHDWATVASSNAAEAESTLNRDGFVAGFGKTWADLGSGHGLVESVMAFSGGRGARQALAAMEQGDKSSNDYQKANNLSGITPYYGAHFVDGARGLVDDLFAFVKGNDLFDVEFVSNHDDVLDAATKQVQTQYSSAPGLTIPRAEWPENVAPAASFPLVLVGVGVGLVVIVAGIAAFLMLRRRTPAAGPYATFAPPLSLQMSEDGNYWWDGQAWRDAAQEVPPTAQRSVDGHYWWDGRTWRPVPAPPN